MVNLHKKLICYGAGGVGKHVSLEAVYKEISIDSFCDRDEEKCGKDLFGIPIISINDVKHRYPKGTFSILVTMKKDSAELTKKELIAQGIFDADDFYNEDADPMKIMPLLMSYANVAVEVPPSIKENFRSLDIENEELLKASLLNHYFHVDSYSCLTSRDLQNDFSAHLYHRLAKDREHVIPWLNSIQTLNGASVLEVGCGTGSSTVALAEQGAKVTAIDVSDNSIEVAKDRLRAYGLMAEILRINATNMLNELPNRKFDFIIFFASLEHMTLSERCQAIRLAPKMLNPNGHLVLVEIPNRLWYVDLHTSMEPFFHWLPDELAMEYAKFTPRNDFNKGFDPAKQEDMLRFVRWGRGVSYHEFVVALGGQECICVESSMRLYYNLPVSFFAKMLKLCGPKDMHEGFYDEYLYISMKNPDTQRSSSAT